MDHRNVPPAYPRARAQVPPGGRYHSSYCGFGQPLAPPVIVTVAPLAADEAGETFTLMPVHAATVSEYWNALKASYEAPLAASRAHTEKRYEPAALPAVFHVNAGLAE